MVSPQTVTLANSIVGVSVLAMPFCFKQCGIILATLMLIVGAVITRIVCYFLLKAGTITRRRNYELLAWDTFGPAGKFMVEISIIGFLVGTLIAFSVVTGDLGPQLVSEVFSIENNYSLRNIIMAALSLFVALPLGLLRNIDSLSSVSTASVLFYVFLVCKILGEAVGPLLSGSYLERIDYWRTDGVLQCIPIFSMALSCQTQIFTIYESLPEPSLHKMNEIVKQAVNICTVFYFCVGFFGYIAFCNQSFGGNILMTFSPGPTTQLIKLCFLLSIVFSVPLVIFPCRASLHSLIFRRVHMHQALHDASANYIPDNRLKFLTITIIGFTLFIGILIPNIELVLGLVGSTTGTIICIIFPSAMFISVTSKQTTERLLAQFILFMGIITMVVSTYATLYAVERSQAHIDDPFPDQIRVTEIIKEVRKEDQKTSSGMASFYAPDTKLVELKPDLKRKLEDLKKLKEESNKLLEQLDERAKNIYEDTKRERIQPNASKQEDSGNKDDKSSAKKEPPLQRLKEADVPIKEIPIKTQQDTRKQSSDNAESLVKNEIPVKEDEKPPALDKDNAAVILKKLEKHQESQKKLLEEQRQILEELKEHHDQHLQQSPAEHKEDEQGGVRKEPLEKEKIDDNIIEKKVEEIKEERLIEKLSENFEKEKENVKIMEKIEEGLEEEMVKEPVDTKQKNVPPRAKDQPEPPEINRGYQENMKNNAAVVDSERRDAKIKDHESEQQVQGQPVVVVKQIPSPNAENIPKAVGNVPQNSGSQLLQPETKKKLNESPIAVDVGQVEPLKPVAPINPKVSEVVVGKQKVPDPEKPLKQNAGNGNPDHNESKKLPEPIPEKAKQVDRDI